MFQHTSAVQSVTVFTLINVINYYKCHPTILRQRDRNTVILIDTIYVINSFPCKTYDLMNAFNSDSFRFYKRHCHGRCCMEDPNAGTHGVKHMDQQTYKTKP